MFFFLPVGIHSIKVLVFFLLHTLFYVHVWFDSLDLSWYIWLFFSLLFCSSVLSKLVNISTCNMCVGVCVCVCSINICLYFEESVCVWEIRRNFHTFIFFIKSSSLKYGIKFIKWPNFLSLWMVLCLRMHMFQSVIMNDVLFQFITTRIGTLISIYVFCLPKTDD